MRGSRGGMTLGVVPHKEPRAERTSHCGVSFYESAISDDELRWRCVEALPELKNGVESEVIGVIRAIGKENAEGTKAKFISK